MKKKSQNIKKKILKDFIKILKNICGKKISPLHEPFHAHKSTIIGGLCQSLFSFHFHFINQIFNQYQ